MSVLDNITITKMIENLKINKFICCSIDEVKKYY